MHRSKVTDDPAFAAYAAARGVSCAVLLCTTSCHCVVTPLTVTVFSMPTIACLLSASCADICEAHFAPVPSTATPPSLGLLRISIEKKTHQTKSGPSSEVVQVALGRDVVEGNPKDALPVFLATLQRNISAYRRAFGKEPAQFRFRTEPEGATTLAAVPAGKVLGGGPPAVSASVAQREQQPPSNVATADAAPAASPQRQKQTCVADYCVSVALDRALAINAMRCSSASGGGAHRLPPMPARAASAAASPGRPRKDDKLSLGVASSASAQNTRPSTSQSWMGMSVSSAASNTPVTPTTHIQRTTNSAPSKSSRGGDDCSMLASPADDGLITITCLDQLEEALLDASSNASPPPPPVPPRGDDPWAADWNMDVLRRLIANDAAIDEVWVCGGSDAATPPEEADVSSTSVPKAAGRSGRGASAPDGSTAALLGATTTTATTTTRCGSASYNFRQSVRGKARRFLSRVAADDEQPSHDGNNLAAASGTRSPFLSPHRQHPAGADDHAEGLALLSVVRPAVGAAVSLQPLLDALVHNTRVTKLVFEDCPDITDAFIATLAKAELHKSGANNSSSNSSISAPIGIAHITLIHCHAVTDGACRTLQRWVANPSGVLERVMMRGARCPFSYHEYEALQKASARKILMSVMP